MLILISIFSVFGTFVPQNASNDIYIYKYGEIFFKFFDFFDLFDIFHSYLFVFLLFVLIINIIFCTFDKISIVWKSLFTSYLNQVVGFKKKLKKKSIFLNTEFVDIYKVCSSIFTNEFKKYKIIDSPSSIVFYAESGRWSRFGVHIIHLSFILLILGGVVTNLFGVEGYVNLLEGDKSSTLILKDEKGTKKLDFSIFCDYFNVQFYKNGLPKEYLSNLSIIKNEKIVKQESLRVNKPIYYNGFYIFQSSYGKTVSKNFKEINLLKNIIINIKSKNTGLIYTKKLSIGETVNLPENLGQFTVVDFFPISGYNGINLGESLFCEYLPLNSNLIKKVLLPIKFVDFDLTRNDDIIFFLSKKFIDKINFEIGKNIVYYTGLQITKDPGKFVVYSGFVFIILGFAIVLFISHKQIYLEIYKNSKMHEIIIFGRSNRNQLNIRMTLDKISKKIFLMNSK